VRLQPNVLSERLLLGDVVPARDLTQRMRDGRLELFDLSRWHVLAGRGVQWLLAEQLREWVLRRRDVHEPDGRRLWHERGRVRAV
jgi:hypothetical protein